MSQVDPRVFDEPACEHNQGKSAARKKAGCAKPKPGAAAGGCAFDGAMITLVPIADAAHVVHGPIACLGNSWDGRGSLSSGPQLFRRGFTSDVREHDVIFGGEERLFHTITDVVAEHAPAAVFVYSTCVTATIGDDLVAVCAAAAARTGVPVIPVQSPGFAGSKNLGNRLAGQALLDHVVGTREPELVTTHDVALIGEYNIAGELWQVTDLLTRLGIRVLSSISGDGRYGDVAAAHRARASMVVCSRALLGLARGLWERYRIPWFEGSFYGVRATSAALRGFAQLLDADADGDGAGGGGALRRRTERLIAGEEARAAAALAPYRQRLAGVRAVLYTGGNKSWSVVSALQDIGVEVVASGATKATEGDVGRIEELLGADGQVIKDGNPAQLLRLVRESGADILIAGGRNQYTAIKGRVPFVDINQERHHGYAGYTGVVELARQVELAVTNPAWRPVGAPAPWERSEPCPVAEVA